MILSRLPHVIGAGRKRARPCSFSSTGMLPWQPTCILALNSSRNWCSSARLHPAACASSSKHAAGFCAATEACRAASARPRHSRDQVCTAGQPVTVSSAEPHQRREAGQAATPASLASTSQAAALLPVAASAVCATGLPGDVAHAAAVLQACAELSAEAWRAGTMQQLAQIALSASQLQCTAELQHQSIHVLHLALSRWPAALCTHVPADSQVQFDASNFCAVARSITQVSHMLRDDLALRVMSAAAKVWAGCPPAVAFHPDLVPAMAHLATFARTNAAARPALRTVLDMHSDVLAGAVPSMPVHALVQLLEMVCSTPAAASQLPALLAATCTRVSSLSLQLELADVAGCLQHLSTLPREVLLHNQVPLRACATALGQALAHASMERWLVCVQQSADVSRALRHGWQAVAVLAQHTEWGLSGRPDTWHPSYCDIFVSSVPLLLMNASSLAGMQQLLRTLASFSVEPSELVLRATAARIAELKPTEHGIDAVHAVAAWFSLLAARASHRPARACWPAAAEMLAWLLQGARSGTVSLAHVSTVVCAAVTAGVPFNAATAGLLKSYLAQLGGHSTNIVHDYARLLWAYACVDKQLPHAASLPSAVQAWEALTAAKPRLSKSPLHQQAAWDLVHCAVHAGYSAELPSEVVAAAELAAGRALPAKFDASL